MRTRPSIRIAAFVSLAALACAPSARASWPHDPVLNLHVAPAAYNQYTPRIASDGAGGFFLAWAQQSASTGWDVYAQHVTASGAIAAGWPAGGIALYAGGNDQTNPAVMSDGVGGAYFAWEDRRASASTADIYVGRLTGDGNIPSGWIAGGAAAQFDARDESFPTLVSDGAGGVIIVWSYLFAADDIDIYGAHFNANGTKAWSNALVAPGLNQTQPSVVEDGAGGIIVAYTDSTASLGKDVRAARFFSGGGQAWNVTVRSLAGDQSNPVIATDGEGGAIIGYLDSNSGVSHLFASRLTSTGAFATGWLNIGTQVCGAAIGQFDPAIVSDGSHGAILGWLDARNSSLDVYAERLGPYGALAPGWVADGNSVATVLSLKTGPAMTPDGSGGCTFAWSDNRYGTNAIYALRLTAGGTLPPGWMFDGVPVRAAPGAAIKPVIAFDGTSAAGIAWRDDRVPPSQVYAQRLDRFGALGNPEPAITKIKDVLHDQGGEVGVVWNGSWLDADPLYGVTSYWMWRQVPLTLAQAAVARGAAWLDANAAGAGTAAGGARAATPDIAKLAAHGLYTIDPSTAAGYAWEFVTSLAASGFPAYSYVASTTSDSMASGNPRTAFMVQARGATVGAFWNSAPDSGYSVDNLPPAVPAPFLGVYTSGTSALHWGPNHEADLANYRLYRGSSAAFVPGSGNRIASPPDTGFVDNAGAPFYYKLSAVDIHGNESGFALLLPSGTTDAPGAAPPRELALGPVQPNPARGPLTLSFSLPEPGSASLAIFDASGRRVRSLARGWRAAGDYAIPWDGRDESGRAAPDGLYFVRLEVPGRALNARFVRLR